MTEEGQIIARYTIMELMKRGHLEELDNPLYSTLVDMIEMDIDCEVNEFIETDISNDEIVFLFAIYVHERDTSWNARRTPYAWVSVDRYLDICVDMDYN